FLLRRSPPTPTLFPYTTLFRSGVNVIAVGIYGPASILVPAGQGAARQRVLVFVTVMVPVTATVLAGVAVNNGVVCVAGETAIVRSEEHTSELQSREKLVCRLLL